MAAFCAAQGGRFVGFAGVDPHKGMAALHELRRAVRDLGLRGLNIQCFEHKLAPNDKRLYPLYAACIDLDIPVNIHTGLNFSTESLIEYGRPAHLDEVMTHFPDLRVCASPPGWPWVQELIAVAWRHRNLRIGIVAIRPKLLTTPHSGYEPLLSFGSRAISRTSSCSERGTRCFPSNRLSRSSPPCHSPRRSGANGLTAMRPSSSGSRACAVRRDTAALG